MARERFYSREPASIFINRRSIARGSSLYDLTRTENTRYYTATEFIQDYIGLTTSNHPVGKTAVIAHSKAVFTCWFWYLSYVLFDCYVNRYRLFSRILLKAISLMEVSTRIAQLLFKCAAWITGWSRLWSALQCTSPGRIRIQTTLYCGRTAQVAGCISGSYVRTTRCVSELSRAQK